MQFLFVFFHYIMFLQKKIMQLAKKFKDLTRINVDAFCCGGFDFHRIKRTETNSNENQVQKGEKFGDKKWVGSYCSWYGFRDLVSHISMKFPLNFYVKQNQLIRLLVWTVRFWHHFLKWLEGFEFISFLNETVHIYWSTSFEFLRFRFIFCQICKSNSIQLSNASSFHFIVFFSYRFFFNSIIGSDFL